MGCIGQRMARLYQPPAWVDLAPVLYARALNRMAVVITRQDRQRGGVYRVKDAIEAIHGVFHASEGLDPYDGLPLDGRLLAASEICLPSGRRNDARHLRRQPALVACSEAPVCRFALVSRQTAQAKGEMTIEDYITHCCAVAARATQ